MCRILPSPWRVPSAEANVIYNETIANAPLNQAKRWDLMAQIKGWLSASFVSNATGEVAAGKRFSAGNEIKKNHRISLGLKNVLGPI
jgi:hypothetical protein